MQTLPDYWFVYVAPEWDDAGLPEVIAMSPQASWDRLELAARSMLSFAGAYFKRHPAHRVVFLADVIAWLESDCGLEWGALAIDVDEAFADIHRNGPALGMIVDPIVMAVVIRGQREMTLSLPGHSPIDVAGCDPTVRNELVDEISRHWHLIGAAPSVPT
ncbi:MAG: hypothetical protein AB7N61_12290 [Acidimicrobiia bacterium]